MPTSTILQLNLPILPPVVHYSPPLLHKLLPYGGSVVQRTLYNETVSGCKLNVIICLGFKDSPQKLTKLKPAIEKGRGTPTIETRSNPIKGNDSHQFSMGKATGMATVAFKRAQHFLKLGFAHFVLVLFCSCLTNGIYRQLAAQNRRLGFVLIRK